MRLLLDTNAYSALMAGIPRPIEQVRFAEHVYLPMPVVGEVLFGFALGSRAEDNRRGLEEFLSERTVSLAGIDYEVCELYARIGERLRASGCPIPSNDQWIAATAIRNNLTLLTRDRHFDAVEGLCVLDWSR